MISVFIAGDIVPQHRTVNLFKQKRTDELFHDFFPHIKGADISICNLEAPIINGNPTPIKKSGPCLHAPKETIDVLKNVGFSSLTLANNHFRDQGQNGVEYTIQCIENQKMDFVGGGKNLFDARKILYKTVDKKTIAIINACEHEFSIASKEHGGSNPLDIINLYEDITTAKEKADFILVITHGGIEGYQLPTPRMKRINRHLIDLGADALVNHHQHCFSGYELYKNRPIFYGLGNFCFDKQGKRDSLWNEGFALKLILDKSISFELIPYVQCNHEPCVTICSSTQYDKRIEELNNIIQDDNLIKESYLHYIERKKTSLLLDILPIHNKYIKSLIRRGILPLPFAEKDFIRIKNKISCESHHENLIQLLQHYHS